MSILNALRAGVKVANKVTRPLQATVTYVRETGTGPYGPTYAVAVVCMLDAAEIFNHLAVENVDSVSLRGLNSVPLFAALIQDGLRIQPDRLDVLDRHFVARTLLHPTLFANSVNRHIGIAGAPEHIFPALLPGLREPNFAHVREPALTTGVAMPRPVLLKLEIDGANVDRVAANVGCEHRFNVSRKQNLASVNRGGQSREASLVNAALHDSHLGHADEATKFRLGHRQSARQFQRHACDHIPMCA